MRGVGSGGRRRLSSKRTWSSRPQADVGEGLLGELEHRVADAAGEDVVAGLVLLEHQPRPEHDVAGE